MRRTAAQALEELEVPDFGSALVSPERRLAAAAGVSAAQETLLAQSWKLSISTRGLEAFSRSVTEAWRRREMTRVGKPVKQQWEDFTVRCIEFRYVWWW